MKCKIWAVLLILVNIIAVSATPETVGEALSSINISAETPKNADTATSDTATAATATTDTATVTTPPVTDTANPGGNSENPAVTTTATNNIDTTSSQTTTATDTAAADTATAASATPQISEPDLTNLINLLGDQARVTEFKNNLELIQKAEAPAEEEKATLDANTVTTGIIGQLRNANMQLYKSIISLPDAKIQIAPVKRIKDETAEGGYRNVRQWKTLLIYLFGSFAGIWLGWLILNRIFSVFQHYLLDTAKARKILPFLIRCVIRVALVFLPIVILFYLTRYIMNQLLVDNKALQLTIAEFTRPLIGLFLLDGIIRLAIAPYHPRYRLISCRNIVAKWLMNRIYRVGFTFFLVLLSYALIEIPRPPSASINYLIQCVTGIIYILSLISFTLALRRVVSLYYSVYREKFKNNQMIWLYDWMADFWYFPIIFFLTAIGFYWFLDIRNREIWLIYNTAGPFIYFILLLAGIHLSEYLSDKFIKRFESKSEQNRKHKKQAETMTSVIKSIATFSIFAMIVMYIFVVFAGLGFDSLNWIKTERGSKFINVMVSLIVVGIVWTLIKEITNTFMDRYLSTTNEEGEYINDNSRMRTVLPLLKNIFLIAVSIFFILMALSVIGINITPFLAGAGVIGIAIGFGSQKLVSDFITGVFMLIEDTMQVGDVVQVNGFSGTIEHLSIRTLQLRDVEGSVHTIPFSAIDNVTNLTKDFAYAVITVGVGYRENVDHVMEVLAKIGEEMIQEAPWSFYIMEELEIMGVDSLADSSVNIKVRFKARPGKKFSLVREFNRRVKNRFDELDIEIPFPHMTLYFGVDKHGKAPPAHIRYHEEPLEGTAYTEEPPKKVKTKSVIIDSDVIDDDGET